jgi:hypothetical protein
MPSRLAGIAEIGILDFLAHANSLARPHWQPVQVLMIV